jgi:hypothetical protein
MAIGGNTEVEGAAAVGEFEQPDVVGVHDAFDVDFHFVFLSFFCFPCTLGSKGIITFFI